VIFGGSYELDDPKVANSSLTPIFCRKTFDAAVPHSPRNALFGWAHRVRGVPGSSFNGSVAHALESTLERFACAAQLPKHSVQRLKGLLARARRPL
jgi:hypothetical protein